MKYMGSKAKVARYIVPIIQEQIERSGYETYLEPFCGGCNVIDKIEAPQRIASQSQPRRLPGMVCRLCRFCGFV